jgi:hypothetical protein
LAERPQRGVEASSTTEQQLIATLVVIAFLIIHAGR